jgi:hypothetical protein
MKIVPHSFPQEGKFLPLRREVANDFEKDVVAAISPFFNNVTVPAHHMTTVACTHTAVKPLQARTLFSFIGSHDTV